jgi:hypothetical protein
VASAVCWIEAQLETDFALLHVSQPGPYEFADAGLFVATSPGSLGVRCGFKYAHLSVRVERWDQLPPEVDDGWEDWDEWPWRTEPDRAPELEVAGFDPAQPSDPSLNLGDLVEGRIDVHARGRYIRPYGASAVDEPLEPEHYLVRLWPEPPGQAEVQRRARRVRGGYARRVEFVNDLFYLTSWAPPEGIVASPVQIARRLALDTGWTITALQEEHRDRAARGARELFRGPVADRLDADTELLFPNPSTP